MKLEELKKIVFLLEHGYFDDKVLKYANRTKPKTIEHYELKGTMMIPVTSDGVLGFYGSRDGFYKELLNQFRRDWAQEKLPEIKQIIGKVIE